MAIEIERKFLVLRELLPELGEPSELRQGYLSTEPVVRVRLSKNASGSSARLTIKGPGLLSRTELEYPIPLEDAPALFALCKSSLSKFRYRIGRWEIDHFQGLARGELWLAEIELASEEEPFERPHWLGREVSGEPEFSNSRLAAG